MMYLSKGLLLRKDKNALIVSHCGAEYELTGERAAIWEGGRQEPREITPVQEQIIKELAEKNGLAETSPDTGNEAVFRILVNCVICPIVKPAFPALWSQPERRLYNWITKAGLRLTIAELIYLNENKIEPARGLLGEKNRQALTETIYNANSIADGILESRMELSPELDSTISAVMGLLRRNVIFLV